MGKSECREINLREFNQNITQYTNAHYISIYLNGMHYREANYKDTLRRIKIHNEKYK